MEGPLLEATTAIWTDKVLWLKLKSALLLQSLLTLIALLIWRFATGSLSAVASVDFLWKGSWIMAMQCACTAAVLVRRSGCLFPKKNLEEIAFLLLFLLLGASSVGILTSSGGDTSLFVCVLLSRDDLEV